MKVPLTASPSGQADVASASSTLGVFVLSLRRRSELLTGPSQSAFELSVSSGTERQQAPLPTCK